MIADSLVYQIQANKQASDQTRASKVTGVHWLTSKDSAPFKIVALNDMESPTLSGNEESH